MAANRFYFLMLLSLLILLGFLSYQIFLPFLTPIAWAIVLCIVFYPVYAFVLKVIKFKAAASLLTLIMILVVIMGPFSYISYALVDEIRDFVTKIDANIEQMRSFMEDRSITSVVNRVQPYLGIEGPADGVIVEGMKRMGKKIVEGLSTGLTNIVSVAVNFLFTAFTIFFLLKDGPGFLQEIRDYLPFSEQHKDRLAGQVKDMIISTIYGGVIVAIIQGIIGGIAFAVLGIESPIFWGTVMALMSFVPMLGTAIVWGPASALLLLKGAYLKGAALVLTGIFVISMVDNILKPLIIGGRTKMPTIIIFFTVLGGLKLFGLVGLVMGPLVFALFLSIFEIFRTIEGGTNA